MSAKLEYIIYFAGLLLLQVLFFNNMNLSIYIVPLVYVAFIVILPSRTPQWVVIVSSFALGVLIDLFSGTSGLNTIASTLIAYCRPMILNYTVGRDIAKEGVTPIPAKIGMGKTLRYLIAMVGLHCFVYFTFESLTFDLYYLTLLRIVLSTIVSVAVIYVVISLFVKQ